MVVLLALHTNTVEHAKHQALHQHMIIAQNVLKVIMHQQNMVMVQNYVHNAKKIVQSALHLMIAPDASIVIMHKIISAIHAKKDVPFVQMLILVLLVMLNIIKMEVHAKNAQKDALAVHRALLVINAMRKDTIWIQALINAKNVINPVKNVMIKLMHAFNVLMAIHLTNLIDAFNALWNIAQFATQKNALIASLNIT